MDNLNISEYKIDSNYAKNMLYEFHTRLKKLNMSRKKFAALSGSSLNTINNWSITKPVPLWVISWLDNYYLARKYKIIESLLKENIKKSDVIQGYVKDDKDRKSHSVKRDKNKGGGVEIQALDA